MWGIDAELVWWDIEYRSSELSVGQITEYRTYINEHLKSSEYETAGINKLHLHSIR